jgi:hypothetical protein
MTTMNDNKHSLLKWELTGIVVVFLLGALFHFLFELTGSHPPVGAFVPVNESVFEHLKLTYWPTVIWAIFSYNFLRSTANNFIIAKATAVIIMPLMVLAIFYTYTSFTDDNVIIDILSLLAAVAVGQYINYLILKFRPLPVWLTVLSVFLIAVVACLYVVLTFYPPHTQLFMDTNTNAYGIPSN